jgi:hypothetical protein
VTLSDEEARRRGTQKSVLERKAPPTFDVVIEIQDRDTLNVHHDVAAAVDALLRGRPLSGEIRHRRPDGEIEKHEQAFSPGEALQRASGRMEMVGDSRERRRDRRSVAIERPPPRVEPEPMAASLVEEGVPDGRMTHGALRPLSIYPYGVSQNRLKQAARALNLPVTVVSELGDANVLLTLRSYYRKRPQIIADAERRGTTVYVLRSNTVAQMEGALSDIFGIKAQHDPFEQALRETREAIEEVRRGASSVELSPQSPYVRRHQHDLARAANLLSRSKGKEPHRRVRIYANNSV